MMAAGAGGAAVAGGLGLGLRLYKIATGFGLPAAAVELTAADALDAAAVKQMGGAGALPEVAKKAGLGIPLLAGGLVLGGTAAIGYLLSEYGDPSKAIAAGGKPDAGTQMNPGDELPGLSGSTDAPSWAPKAQETGKAIGTEIGKGIVGAPLPPQRPAMLDEFKDEG